MTRIRALEPSGSVGPACTRVIPKSGAHVWSTVEMLGHSCVPNTTTGDQRLAGLLRCADNCSAQLYNSQSAGMTLDHGKSVLNCWGCFSTTLVSLSVAACRDLVSG